MLGYYAINPGGSSQEDTFGPHFFKSRFYTWIREACVIDGRTPVLELVLTTGQTIDVANILDVRDDYMLVEAFIDTRDCSHTYQTFLRYQTIYRINVLQPMAKERPIGFNVKSQPMIELEQAETAGAQARAEKKTDNKG